MTKHVKLRKSPKNNQALSLKTGVSRRAMLYFLRNRVGKAVRLRERRGDAAKQ